MSKYLLLHPDDVARVKPVDGIAIERDMFGVTKPGEGFMVNLPEPLPFMPMRQLLNRMHEEVINSCGVPAVAIAGSGGSASAVREHLEYSNFRYSQILPRLPPALSLSNLMSMLDSIDRSWRRRERKLVSLKRKLVSLKRRAREQRRMDWESNTRRRKRRKELQRRKHV